MINIGDIYLLNNKFDFIVVEESNFLLPNTSEGIRKEKLFSIDEVGKFIVDNLDGVSNVETIISKVCCKYNVERLIAERDTISFLEELLENDLIKNVSSRY